MSPSSITELRAPDGKFVSARTPLERFIEKCRFNPYTGCVEWIGARTRGQGHTSWYGRFWYIDRMVLAHRWAAEHIHGLAVTPDVQVDHCCYKDRPCNTLCVQHLQVVTPTVNRELQWIRVQVGLDPEPEPYAPDDDAWVPFFTEPEWLKYA